MVDGSAKIEQVDWWMEMMFRRRGAILCGKKSRHSRMGGESIAEVRGKLTAAEVPLIYELRHSLLELYNSGVRPVHNRTKNTKINLDIALRHIIDVDEKRQLLKATFWMRMVRDKYEWRTGLLTKQLAKQRVQYWRDEFIIWNKENWGGIEDVKMRADDLWTPDLCIYNSLYPAVSHKGAEDFYMNVNSSGFITWLAPVVVDTSCKFNVRKFPYDTQECRIIFGSWVDQLDDIDVDYLREEEVHMLLKFNRLPGFYITYIYIPPIIIIFSSLAAFYLPTGSEAKVNLAVIGLLSQTVFLLIINELLPPDSENSSLLGQCLTILLVIQSAAVILVVFVKRMYEDAVHKTAAPGKRMLTVMNYLKYPLCLWHIDYQPLSIEPDTNKETQRTDLLDKEPAACQELSTMSFHSIEEEESSFTQSADQSDEALDKAIREILEEICSLKRFESRCEVIVKQWQNIATMYDSIFCFAFNAIVVAVNFWFLNLRPAEDK
ncbi:neuronal acetylcholine receptor subunit alpha-10-like [Watersipora subatra]|uniref:neuronal acetylcholine receptor subunit alpha-10-like n=1 Tax=Watersipora subatra TaxID=2589382 RepID=UPI00355C6A37